MSKRRINANLIYVIMVFTLGVIGFWIYKVLFWLLGILWDKL